RTADAELEWPADRRPKLQGAHARLHLLEFGTLQCGEDTRLHRWANLKPFCDYDALREEVIRELLIKRQIKADGATADVEGPVFNVGVSLHDFLEIINHLACGIGRGPLWQRQVNKQFWTV